MKQSTDREFMEQVSLEIQEMRLQFEILTKKVELMTVKADALFKALQEKP